MESKFFRNLLSTLPKDIHIKFLSETLEDVKYAVGIKGSKNSEILDLVLCDEEKLDEMFVEYIDNDIDPKEIKENLLEVFLGDKDEIYSLL